VPKSVAVMDDVSEVSKLYICC